MIGHLGGNPSGYECLRPFKEKNPKGKVVLYTKAEDISLSQFNLLRLADRMFQRSGDDDRLFDNANEMFEVIRDVLREPGVVESVDLDKLTIAQIIKKLTLAQLWGVGGAIVAVLSSVAYAAYKLGTILSAPK